MNADTARRTLDAMAPSGLTTHPLDNARAVAIILAGRALGVEPYAIEMVKAKRASWKTWQARTQRYWQSQTRRPSRARHHDSIAIRETYVRCHQP